MKVDGFVYSVDFQGCLLMECECSIYLSIHLMQQALGECLLHAKQCAGCHYHRNKAWALPSGPSGVVVGRVRGTWFPYMVNKSVRLGGGIGEFLPQLQQVSGDPCR